MRTIPGRRSLHLLCFRFFLPTLCFASLFLHIRPATAATTNGTILLINCGFSGSSLDVDGRNWTGDVGSNYVPSSSRPQNTITAATATVQDPSLPSVVPYVTAQISTSPFTYSFPVSPGRMFVRLYFYPSNYNTSTATVVASDDTLFTVTASPGNFTLLSNFSASQNARALNFAYLVREFSLIVSTDHLNLTFTPSPNQHGRRSNSSHYAFVNGIEIVSMPSDIFVLDTPTLAGYTVSYTVDPTTALETVYRLNVGGNAISPVNDSGGLYRTWSDDSPYIYGAGFGVTFPRDPNVTITYTAATPEFIAPEDVYGTARSMGPNANINLNYNLSWILPVDPGFNYLVRMHFCEIQYAITLPNQRVFTIYLNNLTAYSDADVIGWSGGIGKPTYQDYVVMFPAAAGQQQDLWVALHPNIATKPEYYDAILNGMEVFKLDQFDGNLAGPNLISQPVIDSGPPKVVQRQWGKSKRNVAAIVGGVCGGSALILLIIISLVLCRSRTRNKGKPHASPFMSILCFRF